MGDKIQCRGCGGEPNSSDAVQDVANMVNCGTIILLPSGVWRKTMITLARLMLLALFSFGMIRIASAQNKQPVCTAPQITSEEQLQREALRWTKYSVWAAFVSSGAVLASIIVLLWQVKKLRQATAAQSFFSAAERLQGEALREDRSYLFGLRDNKTPVSDWDIRRVERVCHNYDVVGIMVRHKMLPRELIIDSWGNSLYSSWPIVEPLIERYGEKRGRNFWDDYKWLSEEAKKYAVKHGTYNGGHKHDAEQWQYPVEVLVEPEDITAKQD
jgi:hypothetical protein